jgi:hydrogenase maturation protein HypF
LPGGDSAVKHPSRVALALLHALDVAWHEALAPVQAYDASARRVLATQLDRSLGTVPTSSAGRLLDACAALAGGRQVVSYEGQAAIEFEVLARQHVVSRDEADRYGVTLHASSAGFLTIDPLPMVQALIDDVIAARDPRRIAYHVHAALAEAIVQTALRVRTQRGALPIGLSGGVFQNRLLQDLVTARLTEAGVPVLRHHIVPPNDGGLALGQALVAAHADLTSTMSPHA